jgi:hypothetical protein
VLARRPLLLLLALAACGPGQEPSSARPAALEVALHDAAVQYDVPEPLLKGIGYAESRWEQRPGQASLDHGFGVMHLTDGTGDNTLYRAAALTGASPEQLRTDTAANVRGGAAVLGALADAHFASYKDLDRHQLGDWWQVVMRYSGIDDPQLAEQYAAEIYATIERGAVRELPDGRIQLAAQSADTARHRIFVKHTDALTDYPGPAGNGQAVHWLQSPNYSGRNGTAITTIVIHDMEGSYSGSINWFQATQSQVSAHYLLRSSDGDITHMVADADKAWHAQCYNPFAIGIEHEGYAAQGSQWYTEAMYQSSAALTRWLCDTYGVPKDRSHIIGHAEIPPSCNTNNHTDPGPDWNWSHYMQLVTGSGGTPTGTLTGVVYSGATSNRVPGAAVSLSGGTASPTATADSSGVFTFNGVPVGTYDVHASAAGFQDGTRTGITVAANATIWGSVNLAPVASTQTGTFTGTLTDAISGAPIASATATLQDGAGATVSTATVGADGRFSFTTAPAGTDVVLGHAAGYVDGRTTRTVPAGGTIDATLALQPVSASQAPTVSVSAPSAGSSTRDNPVQLSGSVTAAGGTVTEVTISANGAAAVHVPLDASGNFSAPVSLSVGSNTLHLAATSAAGTGNLTLPLTFLSGADLTVVRQSDGRTPIAGAQVQALLPGGAVAATVTAGTDGVARVDLAPGAWSLHITAPGALPHDESLTVPDGPRLHALVPLTASDGSTSGPPALLIDAPLANANVTHSPLAITGHLVGTHGRVHAITVNGAAAAVHQDDSVGAQSGGTNLGWSAAFTMGDPVNGAGGVALQPGLNTFNVTATMDDGSSLTRSVSVTFIREDAPGKVTGKGCGCSEVDGLSLLALLGGLPLLRARRRRA